MVLPILEGPEQFNCEACELVSSLLNSGPKHLASRLSEHQVLCKYQPFTGCEGVLLACTVGAVHILKRLTSAGLRACQ